MNVNLDISILLGLLGGLALFLYGMQMMSAGPVSYTHLDVYKRQEQIMALIHLTNEAFDKATASGLAMVDFWATWCGPCKMLSPVIDGLADRYEGKVLVGKVNTDEQPELAVRFGVMSIPTVIFLKDGKEIDRKVGVMPEASYTAVLDANL